MRVPRAVTPGSHGHLTTFFESSGLQQPSPSVPLTWQRRLESVTTFLEFGYFADCTLLNRFFFYSSSFFFFPSFPCSCNFLSHCGFLISCSCSSCSICTNHYSLKLYFRPDAIKCYTFPSFSSLVDVFILQVMLGTLLTKGHTSLSLAGYVVCIECIL